MTFRIYVQDLPAGYAAAGRREGDVTVIIVDRKTARQAQVEGRSNWSANLINAISDALDHDPRGIRLVS